MQYEILHDNGNGTARVRLTVGLKTLEQDFEIGLSHEHLIERIKHGLAVFKSEIERLEAAPVSVAIHELIGTAQPVENVTPIPAEHLQPVPKEEPATEEK